MSKEVIHLTEAKPAHSLETRMVIGLLGGLMLYMAISSVIDVWTAIAEAGMGFPPDSPTYQTDHFEITVGSILWMSMCCGGSITFWRCMKPAAKFWTLPFLLATGWAWLGTVFCDGPMEAVRAEFENKMFVACAFMTVLGVIRLILGEGRQQVITIKRLVGIRTPDYQALSTLPQDTLLRAASLSEASSQTLLRPTKDSSESAPEQLLRAGHEPEETKRALE